MPGEVKHVHRLLLKARNQTRRVDITAVLFYIEWNTLYCVPMCFGVRLHVPKDSCSFCVKVSSLKTECLSHFVLYLFMLLVIKLVS